MRLDVQSMARDTATGALLRFGYRGKIATTGEAGRVLRGEAGAATTGFGEACEFFLFYFLTLSFLLFVGLGILLVL